MKTIHKIVFCTLYIVPFFLISSCDMDEKVYDRIDATVYYQSEASVKGAVAAIYGNAAMSYLEYFWYLQEFSADQITWRVWNGGLWGYDEGEKTVLCTHTWSAESKIIRQSWETAWSTIGLCNTLISDLEKINPAEINMTQDKIDSYIAEVRTLRAWAYYNCFEIWGGAIPLYTSNDGIIPGSADDDFQTGCEKVFDFIAKELDESYPLLMVEKGDNSTRNRMNQAVNRIIRMRLLLNSEVFTGTPRFDECATLAQELLNGTYGAYSLANDYREIYHVTNNTCSEVVMAFAMENGQLNAGWMRDMPFLAYTYADYFNFSSTQASWNCCCLTPSFDNSGTVNSTYGYSEGALCFLDPPYNDRLGAVYERFSDKDIRKGNYKWENGNYNGIFLKGLMKNHWGTGDTVLLADADRDGMPLYYTDQVGQFPGATTIGRSLETVMSPRWGETNSGVRLVRYPIYPASEGKDFQDIDDVEFRWAEVYYTLAECKLRAGDAAGAEALVLQVRERYFENKADAKAYGRISEINNDWMLDQWGQEFLCEGRRRRTDLRRFDKFTQGQWWFFGRTSDDGFAYPAKRDRKYEWYPLPASALGVNPGLKQNPNY